MDLVSSSNAAAWVAVAAAEDAPPTPPPGHGHPTACLNCATPLTDRYCGHCGQPAATHRLTMGHLLHEIPHSIWHVDKGIFYTLRELLLRPGATVLGYLRGQRARHFAPLSLLLLVTGVATFLAAKMHISTLASSLNKDVSAEMRTAQEGGSELMLRYMSWIYVAMIPLIGWVVRRALRRSGINLAEAFVAALYITAAGNLLTLLFMPLYYFVHTGAQYARVSFCTSLLFVAYQSWAYGQLLLGTTLTGFGRWWRGLLTSVSAYVLVVFGSVIIMFSLNWSSFKAAFDKDLAQKKLERQRATQHPPAATPKAPR